MKIGAATVESIIEVPQKIKNVTALWSSNSTSGNRSVETQNTNSKEHKHPYVHCSIIYNRQDVEAAQGSISRWVDKTTMGHLHNGILLSCKIEEEENFTHCDSMDGTGEYYAEWNKLVSERQTLYGLTYKRSLMNNTN